MPVEFGVLGPVEVRIEGVAQRVGSARERFVLALLVLNAGRLLVAEQLVDALWEAPPVSARPQLHNMISRLRRRLGGSTILTRPAGYQLDPAGHRIDVDDFRELAALGRLCLADGDHEAASERLGRALALWRGPALADVADDLAGAVRQGLHEERFGVAEAKLDAELALGRHDVVLAEVTPLLAEQPYRERLYLARMLALAETGRRAEALHVYRQAYRALAGSLGVEPGAELRAAEQRILRGEPSAVVVEPAAPVPRQLPPAIGLLTGRDGLLGELIDRLSRDGGPAPAVALLTGPGGVGKTAVAVAAGHRLAGRFCGGQLYADLHGSRLTAADPHHVAGRFLRTLGVDGAAVPEDRDERVALYRTRLAAAGPMLVVLDDAATEEQVRPLLPGDPRCAALVTSRRALPGLVSVATRWTVPVLTPSASFELLERIAGASHGPALEGIAGLCGHLPLAVSIAGARLATSPGWTAEDLRDRLDVERGRLDVLTAGDLDVRASLELSYRALDHDLRRLLRRLALVSGRDFPAWVAEAPLDPLVDVHLVEPLGRDPAGRPRYRLHDLVADFAAERAAIEDTPAERAAAVRHTLSGWLAMATEADERIDHGMSSADGLPVPGPPPEPVPSPLDWFETERANLIAAVELGCRSGEASLAGLIALRLAGFLSMRSHSDDREHVLAVAVEPARATPGPVLGRLLNALFAAKAELSKDAELAALATEQLDLARRLGDRHMEIRALGHLGLDARRVGDLARSAALFEAAIAACESGGLPATLRSKMLNGLALARWEAGDTASALVSSAEAIAAQRLGGERRVLAMYLTTRGEILRDHGAFDAADDALDEALSITVELDDVLGTTLIEMCHASVDVPCGRLDRAARRLDRALAFFEDGGDPGDLAECLMVVAALDAARGRPADVPLRRALALRRRIGSALPVARTLARLARAHEVAGRPADAAAARAECREILDRLGLDDAVLRPGSAQ